MQIFVHELIDISLPLNVLPFLAEKIPTSSAWYIRFSMLVPWIFHHPALCKYTSHLTSPHVYGALPCGVFAHIVVWETHAVCVSFWWFGNPCSSFSSSGFSSSYKYLWADFYSSDTLIFFIYVSYNFHHVML